MLPLRASSVGFDQAMRRDPLEIELIKKDDPLGLPIEPMPLDGLTICNGQPRLIEGQVIRRRI